jgi:hypothetical protein
MGWRRIALVGSVDFSPAQYFREQAEARAVHVVADARIQPLAGGYEEWMLRLALESVVESGCRIIVSITRTVDQQALYAMANAVGLHESRYQWLGFFSSYTSAMLSPSFGSMRGYLFTAPRAELPSAATTQAFRTRFRAATTTYNEAVHGSFNTTSGAPFYDVAHEAVMFDIDYAPLGDGEPGAWGQYVYDAAWLYAYAIANLTSRGVSPNNGDALLAQGATRDELRWCDGTRADRPVQSGSDPRL